MNAFDTLLATLRTAIPEGGTLHTRYAVDGPDDYPNYLYIEQVVANSDRDTDGLPEEVLGQDAADKVGILLNDCKDNALLPGYTDGGKFYDLSF